jgi:hypothetical protein
MRATALNHEVLNDSVKVKAIIVATLNQPDEVGHGVWCFVIVQLNGNVTCAGFHKGLHDLSKKRRVKSIRIYEHWFLN